MTTNAHTIAHYLGIIQSSSLIPASRGHTDINLLHPHEWSWKDAHIRISDYYDRSFSMEVISQEKWSVNTCGHTTDISQQFFHWEEVVSPEIEIL